MSDAKSKYSQGVKILFRYLKRYKNTLVFLSILSVFSAVTNSAIPYLAGHLIDSLISRQAGFLVLLLLWLGIKSIADIADWKIRIKSELLETNMDAAYVAAGVSKIIEFPLKFHKARKMGETFDRISRAADNLSKY